MSLKHWKRHKLCIFRYETSKIMQVIQHSSRHSSTASSTCNSLQLTTLFIMILYLVVEGNFYKVRKEKTWKEWSETTTARWWDLAARSVFKLLTIFSTFLLRPRLFGFWHILKWPPIHQFNQWKCIKSYWLSEVSSGLFTFISLEFRLARFLSRARKWRY
jgi:hypothetical protein